MAANITFKKGQQANLPVLAEAEPAFTTDTKKLFIGSSTGNIEIGTQYWAYDPAQNNVLYKTTGASLNAGVSTSNTNLGTFATTTGYKNYPVAKLSFTEGLLNFAGYAAGSYTIIDIDPETHTMTLNSVAGLTTSSICYATNQGSIATNNGNFIPVRIFITNIDTENSKITYDSTTEDINILEGNYDELKQIVNKIVKKLDIKGYAKIDFRIKENNFYLIEVNSQVSFHPEGEFITCAKKDGYTFEQVINHIVKNALNNNTKENSLGIGDCDD